MPLAREDVVTNIIRKIFVNAMKSVLNSITAAVTMVNYAIGIPATKTRKKKYQPVMAAMSTQVCTVTRYSKASLLVRKWVHICCPKISPL